MFSYSMQIVKYSCIGFNLCNTNMDSDNYKKYVEDILYKKKDSLFSGETVVRKAIVSYGIKGTFLLLQLTSDYCYLYECETDDVSSKFRIKSYDIYHHKLSKIFCEKFDKKKFDKFSLAYFKQDGRYVYDEYYSQLSVELAEHNKALQQALCELPRSWKCSPLYIDGDYSEIPSVVYALQRNTTEIISMKLDKPLLEDNTRVLKCWFPEVVKEQIRIAAGEPLRLKQKDIEFKGHCIECRINAENPSKNFRPCPGKITGLILPGGNGIRIDTFVYAGYTIPPNYDSMIAKIIAFGKTRNEAISKMKRALEETVIEGVDTNIDFLFKIIKNPNFIRGKFDTSFIEREIL